MIFSTRIPAGRTVRVAPKKDAGSENDTYWFAPIKTGKKLRIGYDLPEEAKIEVARENFIVGRVGSGEYFFVRLERGRRNSQGVVLIDFPSGYRVGSEAKFVRGEMPQ